MKKILYNLLFFLLIILNKKIDCEQSQKIILPYVSEGIYNIVLKKKYSCLTYSGGLRTSREKYGNSRLNFRFSKIKEKENQKEENQLKENYKKEENKRNAHDNKNDNNKKNFFTIKHLYSRYFIGIKIEKNDIYSIISSEKIIENIIISFEWEFIKVEENAYLIRNKIGCHLKEEKNNFVCLDNLNHRTDFHLLKLYTEVSHTKEDLLILENEPIDVFIKYIDLNDPNLIREGIPQIKKEEDNEELRYCIRSILKNIPWVRKIFILMPNQKVRYFKNYELINEKIIYVKDKDILGYDSSNPHAFQFRIWKMKEFGLSDNFIIMDDDYFIGKPLNKSDFFYVENNKVLPAIINTNFEVHTSSSASKEINNLKKKIENNKRPQTSDKFLYSVYKSYLFLINYFNSPIIVPYFTHNAIPGNIKDLKEIYDLVDNSKYKNETLNAKYRHLETFQFQTFLIVYLFNKYKRKANLINYNYIDNANTVYGNYDFPLFCINTGNNNDYSSISFYKTKVVMESLFPIPTKYEIINTSIISNNAYIVLKKLDKEITELNIQKQLEDIDKEKFENERISKEYIKCGNQIDRFSAENEAYINKSNNVKLELEQCTQNYYNLNSKRYKLKTGNENYLLQKKLIKEIFNIEINNNNSKKKIIEYREENDYYLKEVEELKNKEKKINFLIYFQLVLITIIGIISGIICPIKKKCKKNNIINEKYFTRIEKQDNNKRLFDEIND